MDNCKACTRSAPARYKCSEGYNLKEAVKTSSPPLRGPSKAAALVCQPRLEHGLSCARPQSTSDTGSHSNWTDLTHVGNHVISANMAAIVPFLLINRTSRRWSSSMSTCYLPRSSPSPLCCSTSPIPACEDIRCLILRDCITISYDPR